jgi:hypothetical protein
MPSKNGAATFRKRIDPVTSEAIRRDARAGILTCREIAIKYGISVGTVYRHGLIFRHWNRQYRRKKNDKS